MPKINFIDKKRLPSLEVEIGANLMSALLAHGRPVASSCLGEGVCSKCHIKIVKGQKNLSTETDNERTLRDRNKISSEHRISCQTSVLGDITIDTPYW